LNKGIRLTNCTLKLKKDTRLQIVNPIPHKIRRRAATRCSVEGSALRRLGALFRVHLKIIRLIAPPARKQNQSVSSKLASERRLSDRG